MIGKKYTKPLMLAMFVAFFASIICSEILFKQVNKTDFINNTVKGDYFALIIFRDIFILVCAAILLWLGTYYLFMKRMRALSCLAILIGLIVPIGQGLYILMYRNATIQYNKFFNNPQQLIEKYRATINNKSMPLDKRANSSKLGASVIYDMSGKTMQVLDTNGKLVPYVPTQEDIEQRKQFEHAFLLRQANQIKMLLSTLLSFIIALLSVVTAFFCYRTDKRKMAIMTTDLPAA